MLTEYINAAMGRAHYEIIEDGSFYGQIPALPGVWANESTLEHCREELASALEDWLLFRLWRQMSIPEVDGIRLAESFVETAQAIA